LCARIHLTKPPNQGSPSRAEITQLLLAWSDGDRRALDELLPLLYEELRRLARQLLRGERPGQTLQTTALVHEAYLRLVDQGRARLQDRAHFLRVAAQAMRRILVDRARARGAQKRGGRKALLPLDDALAVAGVPDERVLAVDEALEALEQLDPDLAHVVELRFFGGLTQEEIATCLGVSPATVGRDWSTAKAWLYHALSSRDSGAD
jgi:RNA polymerase sigma factor (TIGR02999 family)